MDTLEIFVRQTTSILDKDTSPDCIRHEPPLGALVTVSWGTVCLLPSAHQFCTRNILKTQGLHKSRPHYMVQMRTWASAAALGQVGTWPGIPYIQGLCSLTSKEWLIDNIKTTAVHQLSCMVVPECVKHSMRCACHISTATRQSGVELESPTHMHCLHQPVAAAGLGCHVYAEHAEQAAAYTQVQHPTQKHTESTDQKHTESNKPANGTLPANKLLQLTKPSTLQSSERCCGQATSSASYTHQPLEPLQVPTEVSSCIKTAWPTKAR